MIRAIEAGDRAAWEPLWRDYLAFYETTLGADIYDTMWRRLNDTNEPVWGALALADGVAVGLVHCIYHRSGWSIADSCYLQDLYVSPGVRGQGLGRALIEHAADRSRAAGASRLYWNTHETNLMAQKLYDAVAVRSGFIQYRKPLD